MLLPIITCHSQTNRQSMLFSTTIVIAGIAYAGAVAHLSRRQPMTLYDVSQGSAEIPLEDLGMPAYQGLARELQDRLGNLGILDPPSDGIIGPVTRWAFGAFKKLAGPNRTESLDPDTATLLLSKTRDDLFPVQSTSDLAGRIFSYMQSHQMWVALYPGCKNIIYVEGMDPDGTTNSNQPNWFNDLRLLLTIEKGIPTIIDQWEATTEPGTYYTNHPLNPAGAARIALGQYKSWAVGYHRGNKDHVALVQVRDISIYRDANKDYQRAGDHLYTGNSFGINQHWGYDYPVDDIGNASAGCLVGRTREGHRAFMKLVKSDPRYQATTFYKIMTTVIDARELPQA